MNKLTLLLILLIIAVDLQVSRGKSIPELEDNLFRIINNELQTVLNKLFTLFRINKNFSTAEKTKLLLTMHNDLKNISEYYFKAYKDIKNISKVIDNKNESNLFNLSEIIKNIFQTEHHLSNFSKFKNGHAKSKAENVALIENNAQDKDRLLNDFLSKLFNITPEWPPQNLKNENKYKNATDWRRKKRKKTYNLKFWLPSNSSNEVSYNLTRRIYDGKTTSIKKYPFIVSIHVMDEFMCAGSIISKDLIITAASCLLIAYNNKHYKESNLVKVRAGSDYTKRFGEQIPIVDIYFYPTFDPAFLRHNLAIARMKTEFHFKNSQRKIRRIEYERMEGKLPDSVKHITMLGWGGKDDQSNSSNYQPLSFTNLGIHKLESCKNIYSRNYVTDRNFCAGFLNKGSGACVRDVGGPGVVGGILMGLVSFGPPVCGTPGAPTVFTKLGYYVQWIDSVIRKLPYPQIATIRNNQITAHKNTETVINRSTGRSFVEKLNKRNFFQRSQHQNDSIVQTIRHKFPNAVKLLANFFQQMAVTDPHIDVIYRDFFDRHTTDDFWASTTQRTINPALTAPTIKRRNRTRARTTIMDPAKAFWTTTEKNILEHPLVDEKYISMDKFSTTEGTTDAPAFTTTDPVVDPSFVAEIERIQEVLKDALGENIRTGESPYFMQDASTRGIPYESGNSDDDGSTLNEASDNYENESTNNESDANGLSIEYGLTTPLERAAFKVTSSKYITPTSTISYNTYEGDEDNKKKLAKEKDDEFVFWFSKDKYKTTRKLLNRFRQIKSDTINDGRPVVKSKNDIFDETSTTETLRTTKKIHYNDLDNDFDANIWKKEPSRHKNNIRVFLEESSERKREQRHSDTKNSISQRVISNNNHKKDMTLVRTSATHNEFHRYREYNSDIDSKKKYLSRFHQKPNPRQTDFMVTRKRFSRQSDKPTPTQHIKEENIPYEKKVGRTMALSDDSDDYNNDYRNDNGNRASRRSILDYININ